MWLSHDFNTSSTNKDNMQLKNCFNCIKIRFRQTVQLMIRFSRVLNGRSWSMTHGWKRPIRTTESRWPNIKLYGLRKKRRSWNPKVYCHKREYWTWKVEWNWTVRRIHQNKIDKKRLFKFWTVHYYVRFCSKDRPLSSGTVHFSAISSFSLAQDRGCRSPTFARPTTLRTFHFRPDS